MGRHEIEALLAAATKLAQRKDAQYDYSPILYLAVNTGLRLGELLGLQWQDFDLDEQVLHVQRQWTLTQTLTEPKTRSGVRRVPLARDTVAFLRRLKLASKFSQDTDFVFTTTGRPMGHRNVQTRGFDRARDEAGLDPRLSRPRRGTICLRPTSRSLLSRTTQKTAARTMPLTVIENYEPDDRGWGVAIGRLAPPPVEKDDSSAVEQPPAEEEQSTGS